jgi:hypothetical protein
MISFVTLRHEGGDARRPLRPVGGRDERELRRTVATGQF